MSYSLYRYLVEFFNLLQTFAAVLITMIPCISAVLVLTVAVSARCDNLLVLVGFLVTNLCYVCQSYRVSQLG